MRFQQLLQRLPWPRSRQSKGPLPATAPETSHRVRSGSNVSARTDRLDFQAAIIHHLEWCVLFNEHLAVDSILAQHITPLPDAQTSDLGQWLAQMYPRLADRDPRFLDLQREHRRFHTVAFQALALARNNRMDLASTLLNTDFERSRSRVLSLLREMQRG